MGFDRPSDTARGINRRRFLGILSLAGGALAFGNIPGAFGLTPKRITIATAGIGSVYFTVGGGIAKTLGRHSGLEAIAEVTSGPSDNCELVGSKKSDLALATVDVAYSAFRGICPFEGNPIPLRTLTALYPSYTHVVTLQNKRISSIKDLAKRQVAVGIKGSGTYNTALHLFEAAGLKPENDVEKVAMSLSESPRALKDGKIDAYIFSGGIPSASVADLARTPGLAISLVSHGNLVPVINAKHGPVYYRSIISRNTYPGMNEDISVCAVANVLVCHKDMDPRSAYNILTIIFDNLREISTVHTQAQHIGIETGASLNSIPYHPGAQKFYADRGFTVPA